MRVGGRGGRQGDERQRVDERRGFERFYKAVVRFLPVEKHGLYLRILFEKAFKIVRDGVADIGIQAAVAGAGRNHVPQGNMVRQEQIQLVVIRSERVGRTEQLCHNPPERVLRVGVILRLFQRFYTRHRPQNQFGAGRIDGGGETFGHLLAFIKEIKFIFNNFVHEIPQGFSADIHIDSSMVEKRG